MTTRSRVAVGLGSNLGNRETMMARALDALDCLDCFETAATSSLFSSPPWGDTEQGDFLNAVVLGTITIPAHDFLQHLQRIERELGKSVIRRWGPRCIDLDLLLVEDETHSGGVLGIPHPRIRQRPFVVKPLDEALAFVEWTDLRDGAWKPFLELDSEGMQSQGDTRVHAESGCPWGCTGTPTRDSIILTAEEVTRRFGHLVGEFAQAGMLIGLDGPLGAGKSVLVRGVAAGLGLTGSLPSPTYTLCRRYDGARLPLEHWDFYRLDDGRDLESTGFEPATIRDGLCAIEWISRVPDVRRDFARWLTGTLEVEPSGARRLSLTWGPGCWAMRVALLAQARAGGAKP